MKFKLYLRKKNNIHILQIWGEIRKENLNKVAAKLDALKKKNVQVVIIDLTNTVYIDSHGLGIFVHIWHQFMESKKVLAFLKPQGFVKELLAETSLSKIFKIIESEEDL